MIRRLLLLLAFLCATGAQAAQPLRILFIGNSYTYTNDLPALVGQLARASGAARPVETEAVTAGGVSLQWHWEQGAARAALLRKKWDYVVLQDFSTLPLTDPQAVRQSILLFDQQIRAAGARTVLYLTWARAGAPATQSGLNQVYYGVGSEIGALVAPVGPAWAIARELGPRIALYQGDGSHPTLAGSWLAAYVLHITLFGKAPRMADVPRGLSPVEHRALLLAALRATARNDWLARQPVRERGIAVH
ncbi:MAG TPA: hypothetical protein VJ652_06230 [Noviherbaspirillum sp.]|nr:hypothetical protein [Noviherbaspirillum sp.]